MKKHLIYLLALAAFAGCGTGTPPEEPDPVDPLPGESGAILYDWPEDAPEAVSYQVWLDGEEYYVYPVPVTTQRPSGIGQLFPAEIVSFGIDGPVQVEIRPLFAASSVKIRPESAGITPTFENNRIKFTIDKPVMLSVEMDGDITKPLLIFANEPEDESEIPDPEDEGVIYYESGKIHDLGTTAHKAIPTGQTLYIAPGAIVKGAFFTYGTDGVKVRGRGIVSGEDIQGDTRTSWRPMELSKATNVSVEGITLVDCKNWTMPVMGCDGVNIKNVRIVSNTGFEDGIDIVGSKNVTVEGCFIRTKDDCIALKAGIDYFQGFYSESIVENITVKDCVIWNGAHGNGIDIGFETRTDYIRDITFENLDMIHVENPGNMDEATFAIHNGERATVQNVLFKNIRVEDPQRMLIDLKVLKSEYSRGNVRGKISGVTFDNITVTSSRGSLHSAMMGYDHTVSTAYAANIIENIRFRNFYVNGTKITGYAGSNPAANQLLMYTFNTSNITFE